MRAYIYYGITKDDGYSGPGAYSLVTEDKVTLYHRWCSNRAFANHDLTIGVQTMLQDNGITEVYSNGVMVWSEGKMSDKACADFRSANYEYERNNSDAL